MTETIRMKQGGASWLTFTNFHAEPLPGLCHARQPKVMQVGGTFCTHVWLTQYSFCLSEDRKPTTHSRLLAMQAGDAWVQACMLRQAGR